MAPTHYYLKCSVMVVSPKSELESDLRAGVSSKNLLTFRRWATGRIVPNYSIFHALF